MNESPIISFVPIEVARDYRLSRNELSVLIALFSSRDEVANLAPASLDYLAETTGLPCVMVRLALNGLNRLGWNTNAADESYLNPPEVEP